MFPPVGTRVEQKLRRQIPRSYQCPEFDCAPTCVLAV